jgi:hypothetical protein
MSLRIRITVAVLVSASVWAEPEGGVTIGYS